MRARLGVIGLLVLAPVACADTADGLVDKAIGRWHCTPEPGDEAAADPYDVEVGRGTYTWFNPDGSVQIEDTWSLDDGEVRLGVTNAAGEQARVTGVEEDAERIGVHVRPDDPQEVEVEAVTDDEVTFREALPGFTTWTCRRER